MVHNLEEIEYELEQSIEVEVVNPSSLYYAETVFLTHKAHAIDKVWYKAQVGFKVSDIPNLQVWLTEDEVGMKDDIDIT